MSTSTKHQQEYYTNDKHFDIRESELDSVIKAIITGKYSWACVLMLRLIGYNPLHYIPYRTYNRLLHKQKEKDINKEERWQNN